MLKNEKSHQGLIYRTFRAYLRFVHDRFFYRKVYRINQENVPADGVPVMIVSNHQNCLCDPLGVLFAFKDRKPNVLARASVFGICPMISKILRKMGLLPTYRLTFDGEASLRKNKDIFKRSEEALVSGSTILMYPEGAHQDKHWLGEFSLGYTKMAFEAAELDDFQTEIFILPCCNHYSKYHDIQNDVLLKFGTPISLKPYYELYKTNPRTAQRQVNVAVREQMTGMMLHIADLENYRAIDFLRNTCGLKYAEKQGINADYLPDMLQSDRYFVEKLAAAKEEADEQALNEPEPSTSMQKIYDDALKLESDLKRLKIRDDQFDKTPGRGSIVLSLAALTVLAPVWLFSLWPNILIYKAPDLVMRRVKDKMFHNSFLYALSAVVTMPVLYTLSFVLTWVYVNVWAALVYALLLPYLGLFAWYYRQYAVRIGQDIRFRRVSKTEAGREASALRRTIYERLGL
jgi:1-acyl-sn-glycerol-3-phosphate acyltransferase